MAAAPFEFHVDIAWGHCDPAGIIYYPNYVRWFDAAYHAFLKASASTNACWRRGSGQWAPA